MPHQPLPPHHSEDDELDAQLQAEIRRISSTIDAIVKKVDESDPVFRDTDAAPVQSQPPEKNGRIAPRPAQPQIKPTGQD